LKTALNGGFRLQGVFPPHMSPEKHNAQLTLRGSPKTGFLTD
jgi:hypothetical protein